MRIAFIILIALHGGIHLFGFFKAFGISEFNAINQPISRISGIFWLLTSILFLLSGILILIRNDSWWISGFLALIFSQGLIISYWSDAKFGFIANMIILIVIIGAYARQNFKNEIREERKVLLNKEGVINQSIVQARDIESLPSVVQKWMRTSGVVGKPMVSNVFLTQKLELKLKPEQVEWNNGYAEQYFTIQSPAFNWSMNAQMNQVLNVTGRDKFEDGKGEMMVRLQSLIPVADVKDDFKINQASLQRFLAEIVWFPSAALSPYMQWEKIDENSARATMTYNGTKGSGVFFFDEDGTFEKFVAMRFKDKGDTSPTEWVVIATKTEKRNGIKIPVECEASWMVENAQWTWLRLKIQSIAYDVGEIPEQDGVRK